MKRCYLSGIVLSLSGCLSAVAIQPGWAEIQPMGEKQSVESQENSQLLTGKIRRLSELERLGTSAQMLVQSPAPTNPPFRPPNPRGETGGCNRSHRSAS